MNLFLLAFFLIYTTMHGYGVLKVRTILPHTSRWHHLAVASFITLMVMMPVSARLLDKAGSEGVARLMAYLGYSWMGFLFFFVSVALALDVLRLVWTVGHSCLQTAVKWPVSPKISFWLSTMVALSACLYGLFEASHVRLTPISLITDKLPPGRERMRIVQISDLHLGLIVGEQRLKQVIHNINQLKPDVLVSTGDLVDGRLTEEQGLIELFQQCTPPAGKFAVTGNHEFYAGIQQSQDFMRKSGFKLLRDESVLLEEWLMVIGLDDPVAFKMGHGHGRGAELLPAPSAETFVLLLKHRPGVAAQITRPVDLQLSGHLHNGQIFPFNFLVRMAYSAPMGLSKQIDGSVLYISRGTGTWGPPFRLFSPPEITVIDVFAPAKL